MVRLALAISWHGDSAGMVIRLASENDLEQVIGNLRSANQKLLGEGIYQWDDTYPTRELLESDIHNKTMFVAFEHDRVIASVSVDTKEPAVYSSISWNPETSNPLMIHRLCVTPEKQGQGVGRKMLDFTEIYGAEQGHDCARVDVHTANVVALATYEHRGFKRLGEVFFPRRTMPFICMEKLLLSS